MEALTPPGMKSPLIVSPSSGTVLTKPIGADGNIRSPSSITAFMYGSLIKASNLRSSSDLKLSRISAVKRTRIWLFSGRVRRLNNPVKNPAVVSVPAIMNKAPLTINSLRLIDPVSCCLTR